MCEALLTIGDNDNKHTVLFMNIPKQHKLAREKEIPYPASFSYQNDLCDVDFCDHEEAKHLNPVVFYLYKYSECLLMVFFLI